MDARTDIRSALSEAARTIDQPLPLGRSLQRVAGVARSSVGGFDHVGISLLHHTGEVRTWASTSSLVLRLEAIQYALGQGPSMEVLRGRDRMSVPHVRQERRWPRYVPQAVALGVRSQLSVRLRLNGEGIAGGLNFYSTADNHISLQSEAMAELFGHHAGLDLGHRAGVDDGW